MQTRNPLLDDVARMATGALGAAQGLKKEIEALIETKIERLASRMKLVSREEFEAVRAVAAKAREEQEALEKRVLALEERLSSKTH